MTSSGHPVQPGWFWLLHRVRVERLVIGRGDMRSESGTGFLLTLYLGKGIPVSIAPFQSRIQGLGLLGQEGMRPFRRRIVYGDPATGNHDNEDREYEGIRGLWR